MVSFKKGDRVRLKEHLVMGARHVYVLHADQVGGFIWAAKDTATSPSPSTWNASDFELVPRNPEKDQLWTSKSTVVDSEYKIVNVCVDFVTYESTIHDNGGLYYTRRTEDFLSRFRYVSG